MYLSSVLPHAFSGLELGAPGRIGPGRAGRQGVRFDREDANALFWGAGYERSGVLRDLHLEAYVVGLLERDGPREPSLNRRLVTTGVRVLRTPAPGRLDFELEAMLELGTSRETGDPSDLRDLNHRAFAGHASAGYRFRAPWRPRVAIDYDYASGDQDPTDGVNNRFDPLFGARAFERGPSGLYGAVARSNVTSPGVRLAASPSKRLGLMGSYRLYWLASAQDAWATAGLVDTTGSAGDFVGRQLEARVRVSILPAHLTLDVGGARPSRGSFARTVGGPTLYFYSQLTITGART